MFNFLFGLFWTVFVSSMLIIFMIFPDGQGNILIYDPIVIIVFIIFEAIGIFLFIRGLKTIIKNKKTSKYGKECYGIINNLLPTGSYVNNRPEYKAIVQIVNPETSQVETLEEIIGFDANKFPIHSYVLCKFFEGDINIERTITASEVPYNISSYLIPSPQQSKPEYMNLEFSSDREYVTIDGVRYKRDS